MTKIYENAKIRVTLTDEQSLKFDDDRAFILSHAMRVLGNQSEVRLLTTETHNENDVEAAAINELTYAYLSEHHRYNMAETIMRMNGGHRMSQGMVADVEAAKMYARHEMINNPERTITIGTRALELETDDEIQYRNRFANSTWDIQVIGEMPEQIGMCRYNA